MVLFGGSSFRIGISNRFIVNAKYCMGSCMFFTSRAQDQRFFSFFFPSLLASPRGPEPGLCWSIYSAGGYTQRQHDFGLCVKGFGLGDIVGIYVDTRGALF